jgi:hypothetical protein
MAHHVLQGPSRIHPTTASLSSEVTYYLSQ